MRAKRAGCLIKSFLVQRGLPRDGASSVPERAWATERGARATVLGRAQGWGMRSVPVHHARARHVLCKARQGGVAAAPRPEGAEPGGTVPPSHVLSIDVEDWFRSEERRVGKECRCRWTSGG